MQKAILNAWAHWYVKLLISSLISLVLLPCKGSASTTNCIGASAGINFGSYLGILLDVNGTLNISCNYTDSADPIYIILGPNTFNPRQMSLLSTLLGYNIYTTASRNTIWANGTQGSNVVGPLPCTSTSASTCVIASQTLYGRIPALETTLLGSFSQAIPFILTTDASGINIVGSGMFNVTAQNNDICRISANNANLGIYNAAAKLYGSGSIAITCNAAGTYPITLQPSNAGASMSGAGVLKSGNNNLNYQLYQAASNNPNAGCAFNTTWGYNNPSTLNVSIPNTPLIYNICIAIPAGQNVPPGTYTDTIIATITF